MGQILLWDNIYWKKNVLFKIKSNCDLKIESQIESWIWRNMTPLMEGGY